MNKATAFFSVLGSMKAQALRTPDQLALVYDDAHVQIDYRSLDQRSDWLAHELMTMGVTAEVTVAICCERSVDMIVAMLAVFKAGGCYLPLDPEHPKERLAWLLEDADAKVLLTQAPLTQKLPESGSCQVVVLEERPANHETPMEKEEGVSLRKRADHIQPSQAAYKIYTSGSTGTPKCVVISHQAIANYVQAITEKLGPPSGWHYALVSTIAADLGLTVLYLALTSGGCLHILSRDQVIRPDRFRAYFKKHAIDCTKIVPSHLEAMQEHEPAALPKRLLIIGGEAARPDWLQKIRRASPTLDILNHYGPTEATVGMLTHLLEAGRSMPDVLPLGVPLGGTSVRILDETLQCKEEGEVGELCIGGLGLARGYADLMAKTATQFVPDPFSHKCGGRLYKTGDLARVNDQGEVEFLGRVDQQVKLGGFRIELGEIEATLEQHPAINQAKVICREKPRKHLIAYATAPSGTISAGPIRRFLLERLPHYMVPGDLVVLDAWPLTANGKIDRKGLPEPEARPYSPPQTEIERELAAIWSQILGVPQIGLEDRFFNLGGDSVKIARLIGEIAKKFERNIPAMSLYNHDSFAQQASLISGDRDSESSNSDFPSLVNLGGEGEGTPFFLMYPISGFPAVYMHLQKVCPIPLVGTHVALEKEIEFGNYTERAALYAEDIHRYQPHGSITLGGWSYGGRLAFEVARQLQEKGRQIKRLIMFDSAAFHQPLLFRLILNVAWPVAGRIVPKLRTLFKLERDLDVNPVREEELQRLLTGRFFPNPASQNEVQALDLEALAALFLAKLKENVPPGYWREVLRRTPPWMHDSLGMLTCFKIRRLNLNLIKGYRPDEIYQGKITYFANAGGKRAQAWQQYATEPMDIHEYPLKRINGVNPHDAMLEPENIDLFAEDLNRILAT